jgi:predicted PurR-regulated permease PerM
MEKIIAVLIPLAAIVMVFGVPMVAILTSHQRKMAELIHSNKGAQAEADIAQLRREVQELKQLIHQQAIAMDNLVAIQSRSTAGQSLEQRIGGGY